MRLAAVLSVCAVLSLAHAQLLLRETFDNDPGSFTFQSSAGYSWDYIADGDSDLFSEAFDGDGGFIAADTHFGFTSDTATAYVGDIAIPLNASLVSVAFLSTCVLVEFSPDVAELTAAFDTGDIVTVFSSATSSSWLGASRSLGEFVAVPPNATAVSLSFTLQNSYDSKWAIDTVSVTALASNPCVSSPCQHGGTCTFLFSGSFSCACRVGFDGDVCELEPCSRGCRGSYSQTVTVASFPADPLPLLFIDPVPNTPATLTFVGTYDHTTADRYMMLSLRGYQRLRLTPTDSQYACTTFSTTLNLTAQQVNTAIEMSLPTVTLLLSLSNEARTSICEPGSMSVTWSQTLSTTPCLCETGCSGTNCTTHACSIPTTCDSTTHTCVNDPLVQPGYRCVRNVDPCASSPCQNDASCVAPLESTQFTCTCPASHTGALCEQPLATCAIVSPSPRDFSADPKATCTRTSGSIYAGTRAFLSDACGSSADPTTLLAVDCATDGKWVVASDVLDTTACPAPNVTAATHACACVANALDMDSLIGPAVTVLGSTCDSWSGTSDNRCRTYTGSNINGLHCTVNVLSRFCRIGLAYYCPALRTAIATASPSASVATVAVRFGSHPSITIETNAGQRASVLGSNEQNMCGTMQPNGQGTYCLVPSDVLLTELPTRYTSLEAPHGHSCIVSDVGLLYCWGSPASSFLVSDFTSPLDPFNAYPAVTMPGAGTVYNGAGEVVDPVIQLSVGGGTTGYVTASGKAYAWGSNHGSLIDVSFNAAFENPQLLPSILLWRKIAIANDHLCLLSTDGQLLCRGDNSWGQLGRVSKLDLSLGVIAELGDHIVTDVSASGRVTFITTANGDLFAIGDNFAGALGTGDLVGRFAPTKIDLLAATAGTAIPLVASAATSTTVTFSVFVTENHQLFVTGLMFGLKPNRQLPTVSVRFAACSESGILALATNGSVFVHSSGQSGLLGDGTLLSNPTEPVWRIIPSIDDASHAVIGFPHIVAIRDFPFVNASQQRVTVELDMSQAGVSISPSNDRRLVQDTIGQVDFFATRASGVGTTVAELLVVYVGNEDDAVPSTDYIANTTTVVFAEGVTTVSVTTFLRILPNDAGSKPRRLIFAVRQHPRTVQVESELYIDYSRNYGTVAFVTSSMTVSESLSGATLVLRRSNGTNGMIRAHVTMEATNSPSTFVIDSASTTVTWPNGSSGDIGVYIPLRDDNEYSPSHHSGVFRISATHVDSGSPGTSPSNPVVLTLNVVDDGDGGTLLFGSSIRKALERSGRVSVEVVRHAPGSGTVTARLTVPASTTSAEVGSREVAQLGVNFVIASAEVTWNDSEVGSRFFEVDLTNDFVPFANGVASLAALFTLNTSGAVSSSSSSFVLVIENDDVDMSWPLRDALLAICCLIIVYAIVLAACTLHYRKVKAVKAGGVKYGLITVAGCICACLAAVFITRAPTNPICILTQWFAHLAFFLVFSSLLVKTWRTNSVFNNKSLKSLSFLSDTKLLTVILGINLAVVVYLIVWSVVSPPNVVVVVTSSGTEEWLTCDARTPWLYALLVIEGLVVIIGIVIAYQARNNQPLFNESRWIAFCIYDIAFVATLILAITLGLSTLSPDADMTLLVIGLVITSIVTLSAFFVPRIKYARSHPPAAPTPKELKSTVIVSSGMESTAAPLLPMTQNSIGEAEPSVVVSPVPSPLPVARQHRDVESHAAPETEVQLDQLDLPQSPKATPWAFDKHDEGEGEEGEEREYDDEEEEDGEDETVV